VKYLLLLLLPSLVYSQSTVQSFKKVKSDTLASVTATGQIVFADSNVYLLLPSGARHKLDSTGAGGAAGSGVLDSIRAGFGIDTVLIGDSVITVLVDSTVIATLYDISLKLNSADTTTIRNYSNALYLKNADSTTQRTYSNSIYLKNADSTTLKNSLLKNADSTSIRNYSNSIYLKNADSTTLKNGLLKNADSTSIRNYSNSLYLKNADSTTQRTYSNSLYLKNADSTSIRNYSTSLYLPKISPTSSGTMSLNDAAASNIFNMTATDINTNISTASQSRDSSAFNFRFTSTGKPLFEMVGPLGAGSGEGYPVRIDSFGIVRLQNPGDLFLGQSATNASLQFLTDDYAEEGNDMGIYFFPESAKSQQVTLRVHKFGNDSSLHRHFSIYTRGADYDTDKKRLDIDYGKDHSNIDFQEVDTFRIYRGVRTYTDTSNFKMGFTSTGNPFFEIKDSNAVDFFRVDTTGRVTVRNVNGSQTTGGISITETDGGSEAVHLSSSAAQGYLALKGSGVTTVSLAGFADAYFIGNSGNQKVGVGTSSPDAKVSIVGTATTPTFNITNTTTNTTQSSLAQETDTSSVNVQWTGTGKPALSVTGPTGNNFFKIDSTLSMDVSSVVSDTNSFTTTATSDTVLIAGAAAGDRYFLSYRSAPGATDLTWFYTPKADTVIFTRGAAGTSGIGYSWLRKQIRVRSTSNGRVQASPPLV